VEDVGIVGLYGVVHHSADNDPRSGAISPVFHDGGLWPLVIASFALLLCRMVMNSSGFVLFTLYCRTQRLARLAREMRLKSR
jgi:hypothetical protein